VILMYHKVDIITPNRWWVSVARFTLQLDSLLDRFVPVYLEDYDPEDPRRIVITFDDVYENVYRHAFPILRRRHVPFELFVIGDSLGDWNDFDRSDVRTRLCDRHHLREMTDGGGRVQWHTRRHRSLTALDEEGIRSELEICDSLKRDFPSPHLRWLSYPYGYHDDRVVDEVRARFVGAVAVDMGSATDRYRLNRSTIDEAWRVEPDETT
jgi:peptidoglycan/xylan/chitin deacetylase (PgdA/CDA1 family)